MLIATSLLLSAVLAYKPAIKDAYYAVTSVKELQVAGFKMDFNDTIYVQHSSGVKFLLSDPSMSKPAPYPFNSCNSGNNNQGSNNGGSEGQGNSCDYGPLPPVLPNSTILLQSNFIFL